MKKSLGHNFMESHIGNPYEKSPNPTSLGSACPILEKDDDKKNKTSMPIGIQIWFWRSSLLFSFDYTS